MSHLNIKQLKGPQSGATGSTIIFDAGRPKWSDDLTTALQLPKGNTATRPASPANGMMRYNTQTNRLEAFEGNTWKQVISDSELLKRYSIKVNFDSSGKLSSVTEVPQGWTVTAVGSPSANEFALTHNLGKHPYDFTIMGLTTVGGTSYVSRPKSSQLVMMTDTANVDRVAFGGISTSFTGTVANGHAFFWIYF